MLHFIHRRTGRNSPQALRAALACTAVMIAAIAVFHNHLPRFWHNTVRPVAPVAEAEPAALNVELPTVLSSSDTTRYRSIFALQQTGNWSEADILIGDVSDKLLLGHLLAQRYLSKQYKASYGELHAWLQAYSDHPQAGDIYKLAVAKRTSADARLPELEHHAALSGYGDDNGLSGADQDQRWINGLAAWKNGDMEGAAAQFSSMASASNLSPWQTSAAAFWAWRALNKTGERAEAAHYLARASANPRTFYGVLARKVRGESIGIDAQSLPTLSAADVKALYENPQVRRSIALIQVDEAGLAEYELRSAFANAGKPDRPRLLALARALNMPAAELSMGSHLKAAGYAVDAALYPMPEWTPTSGFAVDPALVFAFARQESGFRPEARSRDGGMGLMQLMPQTARSMIRMTATDAPAPGDLMEPAANLALGQSYLGYLLQSPQVQDNLIYLAAAYNAGPAKIAQWKTEISSNDPLLFMESIPYGLTRNYVKQVLTSYWVYQEMSGQRVESALSLARDRWPHYSGGDSVRFADASGTRG